MLAYFFSSFYEIFSVQAHDFARDIEIEKKKRQTDRQTDRQTGKVRGTIFLHTEFQTDA